MLSIVETLISGSKQQTITHFHYLAKLFCAGNKAMAPWNAKWLDRPLPAQTGQKAECAYA